MNIIRGHIENTDTGEEKQMGMKSREYFEKNLTKDISIGNYIK